MLDALRRGRLAWFWAGIFVVGAWAFVAVGFADPRAGVATSLIAVFVVGPMTSLTSVLSREIRYLPPTSRDVWVAAWMLSTVVAGTFVAVLQAAGLGIGVAFGYPQVEATQPLMFVAVCAFAYGGAMLPISPLIGYTSSAASEREPKWFWAATATLTFFVYMGGLFGPWAAWSYLPTSFADLGWPSSLLLALGLVAAFAAFAWTPQRYGGIGRPTTVAGAPRVRAHVGEMNGLAAIRAMDRITGLNRLLVPTLVWAFGFAITGAVGMAWYFVTLEPSRNLYESLAAAGMLPFSAAGFSPKIILGTALFVPFFAIGSSPAWDGYTRHLRVLPMSAADTTRLLLATTLLLWGVVWGVLLGTHLLVIGFRPDTLRPELFLYLAGLSALAEATSRRGRKPGRPFSPWVIPVFLFVGVSEGFTGRLSVDAMFWSHTTIGASALVLAAAMTYRSLTRSTSSAGVYQSAVKGFG